MHYCENVYIKLIPCMAPEFNKTKLFLWVAACFKLRSKYALTTSSMLLKYEPTNKIH